MTEKFIEIVIKVDKNPVKKYVFSPSETIKEIKSKINRDYNTSNKLTFIFNSK